MYGGAVCLQMYERHQQLVNWSYIVAVITGNQVRNNFLLSFTDRSTDIADVLLGYQVILNHDMPTQL